jgi:2-oxoglutarate dehydrogenase E2 component (dihydrolipoamide succinyltransferase)
MAIAELIMPKLGESIMEATILKWHKKVGDHVKLDETVLDIATDKVDSEVPSTVEGIITEILFNINDVVPIGTIIAKIQTVDSVKTAPVAPVQSQPVNQPIVQTTVAPTPPVAPAPIPVMEPVASVAPPPVVAAPPVAPKIETVQAPVYTSEVPYTPSSPSIELLSKPAANRFYSPLVLNIANSEGVGLSELERIPGTGIDGRVSKKDILQYVADKKAGRITAIPVAQQPVYVAPAPVYQAPQPIVEQPVIEKPIIEQPIVQTIEPIAPAVESPAVEIPAVVSTQQNIQPTIEQIYGSVDPAVEENNKEAINAMVEASATEKLVPVERFAAPTPPTPVYVAPTPVQTAPVQQIVEQPAAPTASPTTPIQQTPVYTAAPQPVSTYTNTVATSGKYSDPSNVAVTGLTEIVEMDRMRKLIANHMVNSKHTSPHVTSFAEADVTNMVIWREKVKKEFEQREGTKLTFTPMFIECLVKVMKNFPLINCSLDGDKIIIKKDINIGMATALPSGNLIVPVIKGADQLNIVGLSKSVNGLADAARNARLKPEDTTGGTFTLTNVGTFGSLMGTPIINQPQVAILAVGAIKKRAVVIESAEGDTIGIRHMMYLSLSYDHRIVDGSIGASFLTAVAKEFENWDLNKHWFHYL